MAVDRRLEREAVADRLKGLPGWSERDHKLHRELEFASFADAFAFMARVAFTAEKLNHHPDWSNSYRTVTIDLWSHDAGGITQRDFDLAAAIQAAWHRFSER